MSYSLILLDLIIVKKFCCYFHCLWSKCPSHNFVFVAQIACKEYDHANVNTCFYEFLSTAVSSYEWPKDGTCVTIESSLSLEEFRVSMNRL
jgi:hypothetical protein